MNTVACHSDQELISEVLAGRDASYNLLVERHWPRVFSRACQLLDSIEDAEEVTQDAFARAFRHLANFRGDAAFSTWLYQIVTNLARNRYWFGVRRGGGRHLSLSHSIHPDSDCPLESWLPGNEVLPADELVFQELRRSINQSIPRLPEIYREILEMRFHQDLSYEDIASETNLPLGTVKSRIARARKALISQLPKGLLPESVPC